MTKYETVELLKISSKIIETLEDKDEIPNGDFQASIEAQVMKAFYLGKISEDFIS